MQNSTNRVAEFVGGLGMYVRDRRIRFYGEQLVIEELRVPAARIRVRHTTHLGFDHDRVVEERQIPMFATTPEQAASNRASARKAGGVPAAISRRPSVSNWAGAKSELRNWTR